MVRRCSYGTCNSDTRYPDRLEGGIKFVPFPKPKTNYDKCLRWIKLCGRPHHQLNPSNINSSKFVCTKHFMNQAWPTEEYPDPLPVDNMHTSLKPVRPPPSKRRKTDLQIGVSKNVEMAEDKNTEEDSVGDTCTSPSTNTTGDATTQTTVNWTDPTDVLALAAENEILKRDIAQQSLKNLELERYNFKKEEECQEMIKKLDSSSTQSIPFDICQIIENTKLMKYYTGFTKDTFCNIYKFLVPSEIIPLHYTQNLSKIKQLSLMNQYFLTLCKLRNNFDFQDISCRFGITQQCASVIFSSWINYMFLRFGEISIWPPRDVLYQNMPENYKKDLPTTFAIVDCTEIKTQKPKSLKAQSQTYSDYKSCNTLKALVAVDPRGSVIFSSMLFSGSMSDRDVFIKSKFQETLENLIEAEYLHKGDGIMGDKGFNIEKEVEAVGLKLNIPPFASSGKQISQEDALYTKKIAMHRVHVERAIRRIKSFKIVSGRVNLSFMSNIDQIWYVCSFLTNFMPPCIKRK